MVNSFGCGLLHCKVFVGSWFPCPLLFEFLNHFICIGQILFALQNLCRLWELYSYKYYWCANTFWKWTFIIGWKDGREHLSVLLITIYLSGKIILNISEVEIQSKFIKYSSLDGDAFISKFFPWSELIMLKFVTCIIPTDGWRATDASVLLVKGYALRFPCTLTSKRLKYPYCVLLVSTSICLHSTEEAFLETFPKGQVVLKTLILKSAHFHTV